ncbi:nucleotide disphospho-sugar-binding domain-containing protein [Streptomyces chartreusis]|uniref:nucleotide disphospho-sugar-binding domain-containing protein n=1 Tax=Streptomyces chartreusis TaxID=1969 RepID=UPI0037022CA4
MRILVTTAPSPGHFFPLVPFAWALRARGHQVLVTMPEQFIAEAGRSGLPAVASVPPIDLRAAMDSGEGPHPSQREGARDASVEHIGRGFGRLSELTVEGTVAVAERWAPDLVVSEPTEHSGAVAAAHRGVPLLRHNWGLELPPETEEIAADQMATTLARLGLPAPAKAELRVDICPESLQRPGARPAQRMRFVPYSGAGDTPPWLLEEPDRPRVCVTLGSVVPMIHGVKVLKELGEELSGDDVETVIAVPDRFADELGALPPGVRAAAWLPLGLLFTHCTAVVHHGGIGTALTALAFGLPQVALPHMGDQHATADRLAAAGAAAVVRREDITPAAVADALRRVRSEPGYAEGARALRAENTAAPGLDEVAGLTEQLAGAQRK